MKKPTEQDDRSEKIVWDSGESQVVIAIVSGIITISGICYVISRIGV